MHIAKPLHLGHRQAVADERLLGVGDFGGGDAAERPLEIPPDLLDRLSVVKPADQGCQLALAAFLVIDELTHADVTSRMSGLGGLSS